MADADPFVSEMTDFPVLIGCSFFWEINLDPHFSFTDFFPFNTNMSLFIWYAVVFHSLLANPHTHTRAHIQTWPQSVGVSLSLF